MIGRAELHHEGVGNQGAPTSHDGGAVVNLALEGAGDLDRLYLAAEGLGEGTVHGTLDALLHAVEHSHRYLLPVPS
jgi:hypothetical protein